MCLKRPVSDGGGAYSCAGVSGGVLCGADPNRVVCGLMMVDVVEPSWRGGVLCVWWCRGVGDGYRKRVRCWRDSAGTTGGWSGLGRGGVLIPCRQRLVGEVGSASGISTHWAIVLPAMRNSASLPSFCESQDRIGLHPELQFYPPNGTGSDTTDPSTDTHTLLATKHLQEIDGVCSRMTGARCYFRSRVC